MSGTEYVNIQQDVWKENYREKYAQDVYTRNIHKVDASIIKGH